MTACSQANAPRSVFFVPAPVRPSSKLASKSAAPEGARDTGVKTDPRTSMPRGIEAFRKFLEPQVRRNLRRPARGVLRLAPHDPRWADRFRLRPFVLGLASLPTAKEDLTAHVRHRRIVPAHLTAPGAAVSGS